MMSHASDEMSDPASFAGFMVSIWLMKRRARGRLHRIMAGGCELAVKLAEEALRAVGKFA
jgi:hypothetical protein